MTQPHAHRLTSYEEWERSLRNYDWLGDVCPGATDLDLLIERHGSFLVLECKRWFDGITVPLGQHIMLTQLALLAPFTVYLVGETDDADTFYVMPFGRPAPRMERSGKAFYPSVLFRRADRDDLRQVVRTWMQAA